MRKSVKVAIILVLVVVAVVVGAGLWLAGSLPRQEGIVSVPTLHQTVSIARDGDGIPHIAAKSENDAYFALGFVHAQDRLWQMEMGRRAGAGRLAELFGTKALPSDRFTRTLGLYRLAEDSLATLSPQVRAALESYSAGVNAYLTTHEGPLPPEFVVLGLHPDPWRPADSLVWARLTALQLAGNWRDELLRARLQQILPPDMVADLWPGKADDQPVTLGFDPELARRILTALPPLLQPRQASNAWVVSGTRSVTGAPILANDPHLPFQAPILWYLAQVSAPGLSLAGGTVPGTPFFLIGHNKRIAWGMTATQSDAMDVFVEKVDGDGYLAPDGHRAFEQREETIAVRGRPPVTMTVRLTRHGPVISDVLREPPKGEIMALQAVALRPDDPTPQGFYEIGHATGWPSFLAAMKEFHAPQMNVFYADVDGHIGMVSPGLVPVRAAGDGTLPHPGWTGAFDWTGWVPFDALPRVFDPPSGFIVNANNKLVADDYPYLLAASWPEGYRARRIADLLTRTSPHSVTGMTRMQMDELSLMALDLKPLLLTTKPRDDRSRAALSLLATWNGETAGEKPEPLIFEAWVTRLQSDLLSPWLGVEAREFSTLNPRFLKVALSGRAAWCRDQGCAEILARSLEGTIMDLSHLYGSDLKEWRWDRAHVATFESPLFSHIPGLAWLTRLAVGTGGDDFTVQRGAFWRGEDGLFRNHHGAGMRAVYDMKTLENSRFVIATGQSGNPFSPHWGDFLSRWRSGEMIGLDTPPPSPRVLTLTPRQN